MMTSERAPEPVFNVVLLEEGRRARVGLRPADRRKNDNIVDIGDLIQKTEAEMLWRRIRPKSLNEIKGSAGLDGAHPAWKCQTGRRRTSKSLPSASRITISRDRGVTAVNRRSS